MICYRYDRHLSPPAPFVNVSVRCPTAGSEVTGVPAQLDTAADRTILPPAVVESMQLVAVGHMAFEGFGSLVLDVPTYLVELSVHDLPPIRVKVALGQREQWILLGRDVLNSHRLILDGPQLALEIG